MKRHGDDSADAGCGVQLRRGLTQVEDELRQIRSEGALLEDRTTEASTIGDPCESPILSMLLVILEPALGLEPRTC